MHLKALDHGLIVLDPRIEFLSIDDLPTVVNVSISCGKNMFSYEICRSVTLPIHANTATSLVMATSSDLPVVVQSVDTLKGIDQLVEVTFKYALLQGDNMFLNALDSGLIILDLAVEFLSVENLPTVVNVACCTNLLNDFHTRYVKRLFSVH